MTLQPSTADFAPVEEVALHLRNMSTADLLRLKQIAKMRSAGLTGLEWTDLINEAIERALAGTRRWPRSVPFIAFLAQTIRSISSEEWRRIELGQVTLESDLPVARDGESTLTLAEVAVDPVHPERHFIARATLREIEALFHNDPKVLAILHGLARGLSPSEIQSRAGMSAIQYASAQKRIRRGLGRHYLAKD